MVWPDVVFIAVNGAFGESLKGTRSPAGRPNEALACGNAIDAYMLMRIGTTTDDEWRRALMSTVTLAVEGTLTRRERSPVCADAGTTATKQ